MSKSKARKLAEFLRNLNDNSKLDTTGFAENRFVTSRTSLENNKTLDNTFVTNKAVTEYVDNAIEDFVVDTTDFSLTFDGHMTGTATVSDFGDTTISLAAHSSLGTDDITEHADYPYFTNARARGAISVSGDLAYNSSTGVLSFTERTDAEVRGLLSVTGAGSYNSSTGVITITGGVTSVNTATGAVVLDTDDVAEGSTNLYYTNARADARIVAAGSANWNTAYGWGDHSTAGYLTSHQSLAAYAPLASPALTGTPTAPTATAGTNTTQIATTAFVTTAVDNIVDAAPGTLNTLNELAAALGDDANFSTTVTNSIATKLPLAGGTMTGTLNMGANAITSTGTISSGAITSTASSSTFTNTSAMDINLVANPPELNFEDTSSTSGTKRARWTLDSNNFSAQGLADNDGSVTQQLLNFNLSNGTATFGGTISSGAITSSGAIVGSTVQATGNLFGTNGLHTLNAAGNGWNHTINRNGGSPTANLPGGITSGAITSSGTVTASGGNSGQWNTAYGWGNHASAGYLTSSSSLNASNLSSGTLSDSRLGSTVFRSRGSVNVTTSSGGSNSNPFDDAHTETRVAEYGARLISYTGASATMLSINTGGSASVFQIGAHYNGNDFYMRTRTDSSTWQTWKKLWHTGNDGSGSGLDADTVDGQHASAFVSVSTTGLSNYLRKNAADTASGNLTFTGNITQTGGTFLSHGAQISNLTTAWQAAGTGKDRGLYPFRFQNGATGQPEAGDNAHWGLNIYAHSGSSGNYPYGTQLSAGSTQNLWHRWWANGSAQAWRKIWDTANDGSGSGLDADTVDGQHASAFLSASPTSITIDGAQDQVISTTTHSLEIKNMGGSTSGGLVLQGSTGTHGLQMYWDTGGYGFLDAAWANWDIQKVPNGTFKVDEGSGLQRVWNAGNDGSGSGLDADLLDGQHASAFATAAQGTKLDQIKSGGTLATYGTTAAASGRIRCTAPFATNSAHMFQITISLYKSYQIEEYVVGGYMYPTTNQWYLPKCIYTGTATPDIIVGRDSSGYAYISIANDSYTGVRVHSMTRGYQTSLADTHDPWTITIDAGTENSVTPTISKVWHSTNDGSGSGLDADLLDGNQATAFATAAQGTLATNALPKAGGTLTGNLNLSGSTNHIIIGGTAGNNHYNTVSATTGLTFGGGNDFNNYSIGTSMQNIGGNYTKLNIKWHTGIRFFAMSNYGGVRFHSDVGMGTELMSIGNTDGHVRVTNNLYSNGGQLVWNAGTDGSGSGLDADTVDGIQGASFLRSDAADTASSKITFSTGLARSNHHIGHLEGSYNNVGGNSANTNPIYTIGSGYNPSTTSVSGMYGIGYAHSNLWGTGSGKPSGWGQYVVENGTYTQVFAPGGTWSLGQFNRNGNTVWDAGNDGSGSGLDADTCDGQHLGTTANPTFNTVRSPGGNAEVRFSVWSGTTYGIGMTSGVTLGHLNDYAMTFCMNNDSDRGFWWGYNGQGKGSGAMSLTTNGRLWVTSHITSPAYYYTSDKALKENIQPLEGCLEKIKRLRGVSYLLKQNKQESLGFIAQEVEEVVPQLVNGEEGSKAVNYGQMVALLTEAMKEQQAQIESLKAEIAEMKNAS